MVVLTQARQLRLSPPPSSSVSSILFDPTSLSLALMHTDSSFSLYPSISPFSPPPLHSATATVSPPSSSATFLRLHSSDTSRLLFLVSSPHLAGTSVLLRFFVLRPNNQFARVRVVCNQSDLCFDERKLGVLLRVNHGVSVKLAGSINVFAMHSVSARKVWVFAVKMIGDGEELKLMKTAAVDCDTPVFSISVSLGFLILGEENGVRVFPLRPLVKGRIRKERRREVSKVSDKLEVKKINLPNGVSRWVNVNGSPNLEKVNIEEKKGKQSDDPAKPKSVNVRQDSREGGACFVAFNSKPFENNNSWKAPLTSVKAISVQVLAPNKFLVLDSVGELYLLSLSQLPYQMKKLTLAMKVQNLAVHPDDTTRSRTVWISDGQYTVCTMVVSDMDSPGNDNNEEKIQSSAIQVIFASEKIQEIVPLAANAILLLGQANNIFAYAIS